MDDRKTSKGYINISKLWNPPANVHGSTKLLIGTPYLQWQVQVWRQLCIERPSSLGFPLFFACHRCRPVCPLKFDGSRPLCIPHLRSKRTISIAKSYPLFLLLSLPFLPSPSVLSLFSPLSSLLSLSLCIKMVTVQTFFE